MRTVDVKNSKFSNFEFENQPDVNFPQKLTNLKKKKKYLFRSPYSCSAHENKIRVVRSPWEYDNKKYFQALGTCSSVNLENT